MGCPVPSESLHGDGNRVATAEAEAGNAGLLALVLKRRQERAEELRAGGGSHP